MTNKLSGFVSHSLHRQCLDQTTTTHHLYHHNAPTSHLPSCLLTPLPSHDPPKPHSHSIRTTTPNPHPPLPTQSSSLQTSRSVQALVPLPPNPPTRSIPPPPNRPPTPSVPATKTPYHQPKTPIGERGSDVMQARSPWCYIEIWWHAYKSQALHGIGVCVEGWGSVGRGRKRWNMRRGWVGRDRLCCRRGRAEIGWAGRMRRFESGASVGFAMVRGLLFVLMREYCGRTDDGTLGFGLCF